MVQLSQIVTITLATVKGNQVLQVPTIGMYDTARAPVPAFYRFLKAQDQARSDSRRARFIRRTGTVRGESEIIMIAATRRLGSGL